MIGRRSARLLLSAAAILLAGPALAQSPFGVGLAEPTVPAGGPLAGLLAWVAAEQRNFYQALTGAVRSLAEGGAAAPLLIGLSLAYGVLHAAGPGHGKAVISAYVLANRETARNGAILAMASAFLQALSAIALVGAGTLLLGITAATMTEATRVLEIASFAVITALGAWLVATRVVSPLLAPLMHRRSAPVFALAQANGERRTETGSGAAAGGFHLHGPDCGCAHVAPAAVLAGRLDWRKAGAAVAAVGLRPCTGALIVLVFAISQGLYLAGVASVLAMALGTGVTVAALVLLATSARGTAFMLARGESPVGRALARTLEAAGALAVFLFGLTLLGAAIFYG